MKGARVREKLTTGHDTTKIRLLGELMVAKGRNERYSLATAPVESLGTCEHANDGRNRIALSFLDGARSRKLGSSRSDPRLKAKGTLSGTADCAG